MNKVTAADVREYLLNLQGREITLNELRKEFRITPEDESWDAIRNVVYQLAKGKNRLIKPAGYRDGVYKVIKQVKPISVFGEKRERKPPFELSFPRDFENGMEFPFAENVVVRGGDAVLIAGFSNFGKTTIAMNFAGENIEKAPVLLGNEYSKDGEPTPRFLSRLDSMDWVEWANADGQDKFLLKPVYDDWAEHVEPDRINIIDWVNIDSSQLHKISSIMEEIKTAVGNGVAIIVIQKSETSETGRGGQFTKDFSDCELLIDKHTEFESRITIGKVKEYTGRVVGRSWAYEIHQGVKIQRVREVVKCHTCHGFKFIKGKGRCDTCDAIGWLDK